MAIGEKGFPSFYSGKMPILRINKKRKGRHGRMTKKILPGSLWEAGRTLAAVAGTGTRGHRDPRYRLINVCTGEILPHTDVAIRLGRIALVGDAGHCIGPETRWWMLAVGTWRRDFWTGISMWSPPCLPRSGIRPSGGAAQDGGHLCGSS